MKVEGDDSWQYHQQGGQAGRDVIGNIINSCCPTAKVSIAVGFVSYH